VPKSATQVTLEPPAISPEHGRLAIALRSSGRLRMHVLSTDGAELEPLSDAIDAGNLGNGDAAPGDIEERTGVSGNA
jgi:hypothetical protein